MQESTVAPEALGHRSIRLLRFGSWGLITAGFWIAWSARCYQTHDGLHLEHLIRNIAWGALPAIYIAITLAVTTKKYDAVEFPGEPAWKKWVRVGKCLLAATLIGLLLSALTFCIQVAQFLWSFDGFGTPG
jgi:hypothetical protein